MKETLEIDGVPFRLVPDLVRPYYIGANGRLWSALTQKFLAQSVMPLGYCSFRIQKAGAAKFSTMYVHRLVAAAFLPNPENKPTVNHKDGDKANNHVDNLEWATKKEQTAHALATGLQKRGAANPQHGSRLSPEALAALIEARPRGEQHNRFTGYYNTPQGRFPSAHQAGKALGIAPTSVRHRCTSGQPQWAEWLFEPK
jgi:hypothetical protein